MPTSISVPASTATQGTNTAAFPTTGSSGMIMSERDANGEIDQWCWNPNANAWLSTQKFFTGISATSTTGLVGVLLNNLVGSTDISYLLAGGAVNPKIWVDKTVLLLLVEGIGLPTVSKYASIVNEIRSSVNANKITLNNFDTLNFTKGQWVTITQNIQQPLNSPAVDWHVTIQKSGLDILNLRYDFGLQFRLIRG
jgi:hypothetical protein